jgi:CRISPR-associated endonuclease/helicase Cas3
MPRISEGSKQQALDRVWLTVKRHPHGATEAEIAQFTGIERRTLNNYLNALGDEGRIAKEGTLWFPLDFEETRIRALTLSPEEAYTLYLGSRLLVKQHDKRNEPAESALLKLAEVLTTDAGIGDEIAQAAIELAQRPQRPGYRSVFETVVRGYIYRKRIKLTYRPLNGRPFDTLFETYLIEPSAIGYATYAIGYSSLPNARRAYKLERILNAQLTRESYIIPPDFPGLAVLRNAWSIIIGDETAPVVLRFSPRVRERVLETQWHPSQTISDDPDRPGYLRWTAHIADTTDMLPWVRGWGSDVEVLQPLSLRENISADLFAAATTYHVTNLTTSLDDRLLRCWGKTGASEHDFHPALYHMLDVAHVAHQLLSPAASPRWRLVLADALHADQATLQEWLPWIVALHDIGKLSVPFQAQNATQRARMISEGFAFPNPPAGIGLDLHHTLLGRITLKNELDMGLPDDLLTAILEMISGHHGVFAQDTKSNRRDFKVLAEPEEWPEFRIRATRILRSLLLVNEPNWPEPSNVSAAIMALTGFTILCDWLGSDSRYFQCMPHLPILDYVMHSRKMARAAVQNAGFLQPVFSDAPTNFADLFPDFRPPRPLQQAVNEIPGGLLRRPTLTIIEAPTGEGKTEAALTLARRIAASRGTDEIYVALPTTATSNQMFVRIQKHLNEHLHLPTTAKLVHGQAFLVEDDLRIEPLANGDHSEHVIVEWFNPLKRSLLAPFGVGTIDQAELCALSVRHNALRMIGLAGKVVILDEVHAYDTYMTTIIERMLEWLSALGASVILLSATLPVAKRQALTAAYRTPGFAATNTEQAYPLVLTVADDNEYSLSPAAHQPNRILHVNPLPPAIDDAQSKALWLLEQVQNGGCACWITNTVRHAQEIFAELRMLAPTGVDCTLMHARLPVEDRQALEQAIVAKYSVQGVRPSRGIVVGTQVLEQSLDLDFDVLASDLAPVDLLLQRAGRLHRHTRPARPLAHDMPRLWIYLLRDEADNPVFGAQRIYPEYILHQTWQMLAHRPMLTLPGDYRLLIEAVYDTTPPAVNDPAYPLWKKLDQEQTSNSDEARLRLAESPDPNTPFCHNPNITFREDEDSSAWIVAQTRLGQESITIIPLERQATQARLTPTDETVALEQPAGRETQLRLLRRSIRVSHPILVHGLRQMQPDLPVLFRQSPLLRRCFPLWLDNDHTVIALDTREYNVVLDPVLGLVITPKGE